MICVSMSPETVSPQKGQQEAMDGGGGIMTGGETKCDFMWFLKDSKSGKVGEGEH